MNSHDVDLPELTQSRLDEIERDLFRDIGVERRGADARRRTRRRRAWAASGAAAAVLVVAAVIGPTLGGGGLGIGVAGSGAEGAADEGASWSRDDLGGDSDSGAVAPENEESAGQADTPSATSTTREVIATGTVSLEVDDAAAAADEVTELAERAGGYVESLNIRADGADAGSDQSIDSLSYPEYSTDDAWLTVRVPASALTGLISDLGDLGDVRASEIQRDDVTAEAVDLRARVDALAASVDRLRKLISEADTTADLLAAEDALAERQAELDSLRGQLAVLDDQVALSSLTVSLVQPDAVAKADPAGFGDGLGTGWSALVATLNGLVIGLGFLLPWLAALALVAVVIWLIARVRSRRRAPRTGPDGE
ncbi:hypothetical protein BKA24_001858 [Microbacterium marinum]|uniref:DUF4349 domain-containing protein n=1 Tax=Microbacterium marinum TaxID=421115 RepID=A0A7W7FL84_9MICO|nr:DUF4349 domain-containing protein [Microbacterium marinum]MBB4667149.1 hypothetical protein [Microbacterium marinum]